MCGDNIITKILKLFPCRQRARPEFRTVFIGHRVPECLGSRVNEKYPSNCVISSKYTAWNFIPKNLFEQFHRIANIYFLASAIIQLVIKTSISPWTSILPLIFVVSVTAIKQGYEDWQRHKADHQVNCRLVLVVHDGELVEMRAMDIKVGDIVKVPSNCDIPCDLVLLSSSEPCGQCYITTANLDGETNLKTYQSSLKTRLITESQFRLLCGSVDCQQPIADFYRFVGRISIYENTNGSNPVTHALGPENILLRGTRLKNTQFIFGCAIYTGQETKISLNSRYASHKYSQVERKMNRFLIVYVFFLILFAIVWESITIWFYSRPSSAVANMWYIHGVYDYFWSLTARQQMFVVVEDFFSYAILCNYIIPISMYVTVELQKFFGSMFFEWDLEMYDARSDEPAKAKTSDLNEELGQVEYLFTDKTGTLTENDMQFRQCSVDGKVFETLRNQLFMKSDRSLVKTLMPELEQLFTVLALCHTVRIDCSGGESHDFSQDGRQYDYQSSSPDEKALLEACRRFGIVYHGVRDGVVLLTVGGQRVQYALHHVLDFDADRKRMSVIVEDENGEISLLCKGAETAVFERVRSGDVDLVENHINEFAKSGLRTLVVATRKLTSDDFLFYSSIINAAKTALEQRDEKLAKVYDIVENDLVLLGATAVEDRLQDGVVETISALRDAGIKVWVLTGDKEETAVNVSFSAGHISHSMHTMSLTKQATTDECGAALQSFLSQIRQKTGDRGERGYALVIDGKSLTFALEDHPDLLLETCKGCEAVLCCRMTPLQKALVVRLVKSDRSRPITAAIGDGANDVSMIQESDVGLGIIGKEGRQAARYSDYSFSRFSFVQRALLVHGHLFYRRIAIMIQYFFYKNVAMICSQIYFTFFSAFSAQTLFNGFFLMFFNLTFTALPIMVFSLVEKHLTTSDLLNQPQLYRNIRKNKLLSNENFIRWNLLAVWHSVVLFFGTMFAFCPENSPFHDGLDYGLYDFGTVIMTTCVITVNIKLVLETYNINVFTIVAFVISFVSFFVMTFVCCSMLWPFFSDVMIMYGSFQMMFSSPYVWLVIILLTVTALLPDIILRTVRDTVFFTLRCRDLNRNKLLQSVFPQPSPVDSRVSAPRRKKSPRFVSRTNGAPCSRPIPCTPTKTWTLSDAVVDASPSLPQPRFMKSMRRDILSSVSSRRRLISVTSSEGSPGESCLASSLLMGNQRSPVISSGSCTTSFSEDATSSVSSQLFL